VASYTLRQLEVFRHHRRGRQCRRGLRQLYIARPSISTAIKSLEESFGVQLFIRHHAQGVSHPRRQAFLQTRALLQMAHEFEQNALAGNDTVAGHIDIGCFETVAPLYLPRLIAGFRARYRGWTSACATVSNRS
jgi:DNA-binding transcriptional LysR family regulator